MNGEMERCQVPSTVSSSPFLRTISSYDILADGGDDLTKVLVSAFERYAVSNPLHPDIFPAVRKMEAEIVSICLRMYNNPNGAGTTTSGGTESIIMSVKTHKDWAREVKGIKEPEMYDCLIRSTSTYIDTSP